MPTIETSKKDLENLIGKKFSAKELDEALMFIKGEIDKIEGDVLTIDVKETNRPDLWSAEGIAREIRARLGLEKGILKYKIGKSNLIVSIEKSVKETRPYTVAAVVKGIKITGELIKQLVQLQEKVDGTHGRKRKESATGIYDYDKIKGNIRYYGADPKKKKFTPLEYKAEMDLEEILETHPKGKEYAHLLKGKKLYPIFEDSEGNVLSMPPVINSNYSGKVTEATKNLFIEVSGFQIETILTGLHVMVMALADRGGKIESVTILDSNGKKIVTPDFSTEKIILDPAYVRKISDLNLTDKQIILLLEKARYNVKAKGKKLEVEYPSYRKDILHPIDVVEDIIIGYGYNNIEPKKIEMNVTGEELPQRIYLDKARDVCAGLGLQEVLTFNLTSKEKQTSRILSKEDLVEISNPVSSNWEVMRKKLMPELLDFLSKNKHAEYPQRIFEIGTVLSIDAKKEEGVDQSYNLGIVISDSRANFTLAKSILNAICNNLGIEYSLKETKLGFLENGKSGEIKTPKGKGFIGEIHKQVLSNFGLDTKTIVIELELIR
ncbi:MAG: phenylalanine--tRNA ligase subunit beta [archaeon]|nr:phenylalanine--tRNA ligase subunit beta [archaeon]